jgi:hypothetical protein
MTRSAGFCASRSASDVLSFTKLICFKPWYRDTISVENEPTLSAVRSGCIVEQIFASGGNLPFLCPLSSSLVTTRTKLSQLPTEFVISFYKCLPCGYFHLKEEALDRTMWKNRFEGGFEPVVRQNTVWWWNFYPVAVFSIYQTFLNCVSYVLHWANLQEQI